MSDCSRYIEQISAMVDGELSEEQESELRTHMEGCEDCKRVYDAFSEISEVFSGELEAPPEMLAEGVMYKIGLKKKNFSGVLFGRFTAIAACFAVILLGAAHFGLLSERTSSAAPSTQALASATPKSTPTDYSLSAPSVAPETTTVPTPAAPKLGGAGRSADDAHATLASGGANKTDSSPAKVSGSPESESPETYLYGFPAPKRVTFAANSGNDAKTETETDRADASGDPEALFEAKEIAAYEGRYSSDTESGGKNKQLLTITDEDSLASLDVLLEADGTADYSMVDTGFSLSDPVYSFFVPANRDVDESAKDEIINVWFVKGAVWCVYSDAVADASNPEKTMYKAAGTQDKLTALIGTLEPSK